MVRSRFHQFFPFFLIFRRRPRLRHLLTLPIAQAGSDNNNHDGKTFSNDHEFASEMGKEGGSTQPEEVYSAFQSHSLHSYRWPVVSGNLSTLRDRSGQVVLIFRFSSQSLRSTMALRRTASPTSA
jgi:hypothetical protein